MILSAILLIVAGCKSGDGKDRVTNFLQEIQKKDAKAAIDAATNIKNLTETCRKNLMYMPNYAKEKQTNECIAGYYSEARPIVESYISHNVIPPSATFDIIESKAAEDGFDHYVKITYSNKDEAYQLRDSFCKECVFKVHYSKVGDGVLKISDSLPFIYAASLPLELDTVLTKF